MFYQFAFWFSRISPRLTLSFSSPLALWLGLDQMTIRYSARKVNGWLELQGTEKYVPDLELHVLEDCSHWVQQDQPEQVEKLMRGFLERTGTTSKQLSAARAA